MKHIHSSDEKYLAINNDFKVTIMESFKLVKDNNNFVALIKLRRNLIHTEKDNITTLSEWAGDVELLNVDGTRLESLKLNGWGFNIAEVCLSKTSGSKYKQCFRARFIDLLEVGNINEIYDISEDGVLKVIDRFVKLSKFKEFRLASLQLEKEELEIENQTLKDKLVRLNSQIDLLKEILN